MANKNYETYELSGLTESGLLYIIESNRFNRATKFRARQVLTKRRQNETQR